MYYRILLSFAFLAVVPLFAQVNDTNNTTAGSTTNTTAAVDNANSSAAVDTTSTPDDARMLTPPPASGEAYPTATESQERSNYLRAGVIFNTAYSDNVLGGVTANPVSDIDYSIWPTIAIDQTTPRLHSVLTYAPGFTFYQKVTGRDETDQNATMDVQYRLTEHVTASVRDTFQKSSNVFNQPDLLNGASVYGSAQAPTAAVVPPVADRLSNTGNVELTYQFSRSGMVGASGVFTNLHYPDQAEVPGLYDSSSRGGSAFYSHRLSKKHYIGTLYQYSRILAFPTGPQFETQTHTISLFYTIYLKPTLSLSFSGGPQYYEALQSPFPISHSWSPAASGSLGWQGKRTSFAASYSRTVTGGGGLVGAFNSNNASLSARWQMARYWSIGTAGGYSIYRNVTPFVLSANPGGHSISGTVSLEHQIGQYFNAELGYTRVHQDYSDIPVIATAPNTNREYISISYRFSRPLGK